MKMRHKMSKRGNNRLFRKGIKTEVSNISPRPMRGGIRL